MIWWIDLKSRQELEKIEISKLTTSESWLVLGEWKTEDGLKLKVDFSFTVNEKEYHFKLVYPNSYPYTPPMVFNTDGERVSGHQYGNNGELCLEIRPDNWLPDYTGRQMIESCYALISGEKGEKAIQVEVPSAHEESLGRALRGNLSRFLVSDDDLSFINTIPNSSPLNSNINIKFFSGVIVATLNNISSETEILWESSLKLKNTWSKLSGHIINNNNIQMPIDENCDSFISHLDQFDELKDVIELIRSDRCHFLITGKSGNWTLVRFYRADDKGASKKILKIAVYKTICHSDNSERVPKYLSSLPSKKVGIVGCGSVGSKILSHLCRSGCETFLLIDDDVFLPVNVVRNELCINDIGFHKTAACRERLLSINPSANIECITLALGSQVSAQAMDHAVNELSNCDLIIDASASTNSFNMVSSISTKHMKPLVWLEVFAGGIGGLIARSRPKLDPPALHGRNQINNWCDRQGIDWINSSKNDYELSGNKELPFVADDAEVSIIASHAARYAIDILSSNDDSIFPHSAYLIGLKNEWAFSQPFVTHPIELVNEGEWGMKSEDLTVVQKQEILALLQSQ